MSRDWPTALQPYVGPTPNAVTLRPDRWGTGQMIFVVLGTLCFVTGLVTLLASSERWFGLTFACFGAASAGFPAHERFRWARVEATDDGLTVVSGLWRWTTSLQHINYSDVQTVRVQDDDKTYGYRAPILRHVVIERTATPFAGAPPGVRIGEMFGIDRNLLEILRDDLADRSGKRPVTADLY